MKSFQTHRRRQTSSVKQQGLVLFLALLAILIMSLAAVALIRSVDTSTIIAGNLAFKRAATSSGDSGAEAAMVWLAGIQTANTNKNVLSDTTHGFNVTNAVMGYYSNVDPALDLFANATWAAATGVPSVTDASGNTVRYIIQRMCRNANVAVQNADCLFSGAIVDTNGQNVPLPQEICSGPGCPAAGQTPQIRVTTRTIGPKNTISYLQAFVY